MINKILLAILLTVSAVPAAAAAQERPIKLESDVKLLRQVQQGDAPELVAPESSDPLTLLIWAGDGRLDSQLAIRIPMQGSLFSRVDEVTLEKPETIAS